jgi:hypothetical protein
VSRADDPDSKDIIFEKKPVRNWLAARFGQYSDHDEANDALRRFCADSSGQARLSRLRRCSRC